MTQDMLDTLRVIDPAVLVEVVRQDQHSPAFEILNWDVDRFSDKGLFNADALFSFSGEGRDEHGTRNWSVVLKILKDPGTQLDPHHLRYWKRELLAMQSGFLASLPGPVIAPRCYATSEPEGSGWIWMEHIVESSSPSWATAQYAFAAHELGRFNGNCLASISIPDYDWFCKSHTHDKLEALPPHDAWDSPFVSQAFSAQTRDAVLRLWDERQRFYDVLNRLPQCFSHFDYHRRNLLIRRREDGTDEIVALDWAWCGYSALGADLYSVVGGSALTFELEAADVAVVETAAFEAYLAGLHDSGWTGNPDTIRLAYDVCFALFLAGTTPATAAYATTDRMQAFVEYQFRRSRAEIASGWAALCELALERADEARQLMGRLL